MLRLGLPKDLKDNFFFFDQISLILTHGVRFMQSLMANLDYVILDLMQVESNLKNNKKMYGTNCHFQDAWATKLACVKSMVGVDGKVLLPGEWQKFNKTRLRHFLNFDFQIIFLGGKDLRFRS